MDSRLRGNDKEEKIMIPLRLYSSSRARHRFSDGGIDTGSSSCGSSGKTHCAADAARWIPARIIFLAGMTRINK